MAKGKKKAAPKKEEIKEAEEDSTEITENAEDEGLADEDLAEDASIEEEIIEIEEKKDDLGEKFKEIPTIEEEIGEILEERIYTVPFGRVKNAKVKHRTRRAVNMLREFVIRHMKPEGIIIDPALNELLWKRGIEKPPRKVRIRVTKDRENLVNVYAVKE